MSTAAPMQPPACEMATGLIADQQAAAYSYLHSKPGCPTTLGAAMANPAWRGAIHGLAVSMARRALRAQTQRRYGMPRHATTSPTTQRREQAPRFDAKKAAANDHD